MRVLNSNEVKEISGAGLFALLGQAVGAAIGGIVDRGTAVGGLHTDATTPAGTLGYGIGSIFDLDILSAISNIGNGIVGIVGFGVDASAQSKALNS